MAVSDNRKRSANVGHHQYGQLITLADGTTAFQVLNGISDKSGNTVGVKIAENALIISAEDLDSMVHIQEDILDELRFTNALLKGILQ